MSGLPQSRDRVLLQRFVRELQILAGHMEPFDTEPAEHLLLRTVRTLESPSSPASLWTHLGRLLHRETGARYRELLRHTRLGQTAPAGSRTLGEGRRRRRRLPLQHRARSRLQAHVRGLSDDVADAKYPGGPADSRQPCQPRGAARMIRTTNG